jgi:TolA-binding protein
MTRAWGNSVSENRLTTTLGAVVIALATTSGCMTRMEGHRMRTSVADLRLRLDDVDKLDQAHKEQVVQLRAVLDQATALLTANSSDVGAKEEKAETDIAALQVQIERLSQTIEQHRRQSADDQNRFDTRLAAVERSEAAIADKVAPLLPVDKDQLWQQAAARLASGEGDEGRRFYRIFVQRFPQDARAPQAYLAIGASCLQEKKFSSAAAAFQRLLDTFPTSPEVPEAKVQLSSAFVQLRFCTDARSLLRDVVKRYPNSPPAAEARRELNVVEHLRKAECTS